MTDENRVFGSDSRRSFVKKSLLAAGGAALAASGSVAAQQDGGTETTPTEDGVEGPVDAVTLVSSFHPEGRFVFVSGVVDWTPQFPGVANDVWTSYDTYMIRWLNTNEIVPLWIERGATLGGFDENLGTITDFQDTDEPQIFEMGAEMESLQDSNTVVQVQIEEVSEEVQDSILETDPWWQDVQTGSGTPTGTPATENSS